MALMAWQLWCGARATPVDRVAMPYDALAYWHFGRLYLDAFLACSHTIQKLTPLYASEDDRTRADRFTSPRSAGSQQTQAGFNHWSSRRMVPRFLWGNIHRKITTLSRSVVLIRGRG